MISNIINPPAIVRPPPTKQSYTKFVKRIKNHEIERVRIKNSSNEIYYEDKEGLYGAVDVLVNGDLLNTMEKNNVDVYIDKVDENSGNGFLQTIGVLGFTYILLSTIISAITGKRNGPMGNPLLPSNVGDFEMTPDTGVTFDDVEGIDEVKEELYELVDFLKNPDKYANVGASVPRGCLLFGKPGTGKTLLAKAIAGEAKVPFVAVSASEFIELFVGLGASRIRTLFENARKKAPCIIFIDEIDAIGRKRSNTGIQTGGNSEQEQTLNQLLTEMDGFSGSEGIIVIGATNRKDTLDDALLRPGRFDRKITVDLPNTEGREKILKVHSRNKVLSDDISLMQLAKKTAGLSGADLMNIMNEAAIFCVRNQRTSILNEDLEEAYEKVTIGLAKKKTLTEETKKIVAYHESGHAIIGEIFESFDSLSKVSILPRGQAGGITYFTPDENLTDSGLYAKDYLEKKIMVALAGHASEELILGKDKVTSGAVGDFQQATSIAKTMIQNFGFSDVIGKVYIPDNYNGVSETTASIIDREVKQIIDQSYQKVLNLLETNKLTLDYLAHSLMEKETLSQDELKQIFETHRLVNTSHQYIK